MWLPFRSRRLRPALVPSRDAVIEPAGLPAVRADRVLVALAVHAQQLDDRLARVEHGLATRVADLEARVEASLPDEQQLLEVATQDDLLAVQLHSARVSAELSRVAVELQARIDDLAVQMPAVVTEDRRLQRARTLAESILDLSDSCDTMPGDLRVEPDDWAATA
jgi:hypothetical protein